MGVPITINDIRKTGHCTAGARRWFDGHGLNFKAFLEYGIDSDELLALRDSEGHPDPLAVQVVTATLERRAADGR